LENNKNLNPELAELIGQMIYELHDMYQAFLRKESLQESLEPLYDPNDLTQLEETDDIPW